MKYLLIPSIAILSLSACSFTQEYERPSVETPAQFHLHNKSANAALPEFLWWQSFNSAELNTLVNTAMADNNDIRAGLHRIEQSRAATTIAGASLLPTLSAGGNTSASHNNPSSGRSTNTNSLGGNLSAGYELDLFGQNRAGALSARLSEDATRLNQDALKLIVASDTAQAFFALINARERVAVAQDNLRIAEDVLNIITARFDAGSVSGLELAQQKTQLANMQANLETLNEQRYIRENALAILLGRAPQTLNVDTQTLTDLTIPDIGTYLPSELLERRPDLVAAERALAAAGADIGAAKAALFPSINLNSGLSITSSQIGDPTATAMSIAAALSAPIFQGGRLRAGVERTTARQAELAENYRKSVLVAFEDVENALAAVNAASSRDTMLKTALSEAKTAYDLAQQQYDAGVVDFQALLNAQSSYLSANDTYAQSRATRLTAAISLYKALGGGWRGTGG